MRKYARSSLFVIAVFATSGIAGASTKSFVVNGPELKGEPATTERVTAVDLSNSNAFNSVAVSFTLPKDYKKNSVVTVRLRLSISADSPLCNVILAGDGTYRARNGSVFDVVSAPNSGFTVVGPGPFAVPSTPNQMFAKTFELRKATVGSILDQKAGDGIGSPDKALAMFDRGGHTLFMNPSSHNFHEATALATAFFLAILKGRPADRAALVHDAASFPSLSYRTTIH